jgi:hypothetical protein
MNFGKHLLQALALLAFSLVTTLTALAFASDVLIPATTLQLRSLNNTDYQNLEVSYGAICKYKKGIFFPDNRLCGSYNVRVPVNADGTIALPALNKFDGLHARKTDNYEVSFTVQPKGRGPQDREYYFVLSARGEEKIQQLQNFRDIIYFGKLNGATLNVTAERRAVVDSELTQNPSANLFVTVEIATLQSRNPGGLLVSSPSGHTIVSFENRPAANGWPAKTELRDLKKIEVKGGNFAFIGNPGDAKVELRAWYSVQENSTDKTIYRTRIDSKLDPDFLKDNSDVDLKKVN